MKFLTLALILITFSTHASASCLQKYEDNIELRINKLSSSKETASNYTKGTFIGMTVVWSSFGVALVGPWGLLIGPQFGFMAAAPVAGGFYVYNRAKLHGLNQRVMVYTVLHEAIDHDGVNTKHYNDTFRVLQKKHPRLDQELFDKIVISLNDSDKLCDGTIAQYRKYRMFRRRTLATYKDFWSYLWDKTESLINQL